MNPILEKRKMTETKTQNGGAAKGAPDVPDAGGIAVAAENFSIYYDYGKFHAVKGVSMGLRRGKVTAIIGPSGCGKSTFLRCINRMNDLVDGCTTSGLLALDGVDIYHPRLDVVELRRRIGMVFQRPNPFPKSIYDNVAYGRGSRAASGGRSSTGLSRLPCAARRSGTRLRTGSRITRSECRAASSRGCASRALWQCAPKCCLWTNRAAPSTLSRPRA